MARFERVASLLQIREGEGRLVGWLFAQAFFGGIPLTLTTAAGNALFLEHHGASMLPWIYLAAAIVVPVIGWLCLRIEHHASFDRFLIAVVMMLFVGQVAARASLVVLGPERGTWALPVWTELEYSLTNLQLWALAGRLLNVQQAKRLLGLVGSGALLSSGISGLLSPILVRAIGTPNLLLLSATASLASLFVLRRICSQEQERLHGQSADEQQRRRDEHDKKQKEREEEKERERKKKQEANVVVIGGDGSKSKPKPSKNKKKKPTTDEDIKKGLITPEVRPYLRATYALMALSFISYYVAERLFYDRAEARFPDTEQLTGFIGVFFGVCGLLSLIFRVWLSAQLLSRWGLFIGLLALPTLLAVGGISATTLGATAGMTATAFFWSVAATRATDRVLRESLDQQAVLMLYQPLPKTTRVAVQGMAETIVGPAAGGFAGLMLVLLNKAGVDVVRLAAIAGFIAIAWVFIANYLRRAYRMVLERALADRHLLREDIVLGESARGPLLRALESTYAGEVLYALDMLEDLGWRTTGPKRSSSSSSSREQQRERELRPAAILKKLLKHSSTDVRREALRRIERGAITELLPEVTALVAKEPDDRVRGRAYRVLVAIADDDDAERVWLEGNASSDPRVRRQVMTGCLASGSIDRIALAWAELRRLAESTDPTQRILATQVLRKVGSPTFHRPLLKLLNDTDRNVQRAAIVACKTVQHPRLLPIIVSALKSRGLRAPAGATLVAIGVAALPAIRDFVHDTRDWRVRVRALRVAARVKGPLAERLALDLLESQDEEVRHGALLTLVACGHRPRPVRTGLVALALGAADSLAPDTSSSLAPDASLVPGPNTSVAPKTSLTPFSGEGGAPSALAGGIAAFERLLQTEVSDATWTLAALIDLEVAAKRISMLPGGVAAPESIVTSSMLPSHLLDQDGLTLVTRALRRELTGCRDRIFLLLSFLYDAQAMHAARASYSSSSTDRRAIALELLDTTLPTSIRNLVIPLFDDVSARQALEDMPDDVVEDEVQQGRRGRLRDLVDPNRVNITSWTRTAAVWALRDPNSVRALENYADEDVRETARFVIRAAGASTTSFVPSGPISQTRGTMLTVEKVLILRSVPMFERTPDHILSELAAILKEVDLPADADLIKEGDFGDCMFVIVHGGVKVHRAGDLIAELGARDIVGEMSVLDPEPRSASVTTTKPTRVLRIDRDDFFDLMADRIEIAQGILGVLCQRLRGLSGSRELSLLPPMSDF